MKRAARINALGFSRASKKRCVSSLRALCLLDGIQRGLRRMRLLERERHAVQETEISQAQ